MATRRRAAPSAPTGAKPAPDDTREQILAAAAGLFRRHGYAATTLRQIADAAGIKAASIYYHFGSKDEILGEVLDKGIVAVMDQVRSRIEALPEPASARERIAAAIEGHLIGLLHHGDFTSANIRIYGQIPPHAQERHRVVRRQYAKFWSDLLRHALADGTLRPDIDLAVMRLFVIGALNWTVEWYDPARGPFESFAAQVSDIVFEGILRRGRPPRRRGGLMGTEKGI